MVPYLSRLERAAHNRFVVGSSPTGTTKGKEVSFPLSYLSSLYKITDR